MAESRESEENFLPRIVIRRGANPYWRGYFPNWKLIRTSRGFLVSPIKPKDMDYHKKVLEQGRDQNPYPLDRDFYNLLRWLQGVMIFNVSPTELSVECSSSFAGWDVIEPKVISAIKSTLDPKVQEKLIVEET